MAPVPEPSCVAHFSSTKAMLVSCDAGLSCFGVCGDDSGTAAGTEGLNREASQEVSSLGIHKLTYLGFSDSVDDKHESTLSVDEPKSCN